MICSSEAVFATCYSTSTGMAVQPAAALTDLAPTVLFLERMMERRAEEV